MGSRHNNYLQLKLAGLVHNQTYCLKKKSSIVMKNNEKNKKVNISIMTLRDYHHNMHHIQLISAYTNEKLQLLHKSDK